MGAASVPGSRSAGKIEVFVMKRLIAVILLLVFSASPAFAGRYYVPGTETDEQKKRESRRDVEYNRKKARQMLFDQMMYEDAQDQLQYEKKMRELKIKEKELDLETREKYPSKPAPKPRPEPKNNLIKELR
jgi:hypothetical protein